MSASSTILTTSTTITDNSSYYLIAQGSCSVITLPSLVLNPASTLVNANRMFVIKNETNGTLTVATTGGQTFEGGSATLSILPNRWALVHGQNSLLRWNVYRVADLTATGVNDVTYAQLMSMLGTTGASSATAGFYRITDYRTAGYVLGSSGASTYLGALEPLIVNVYYGYGMTAGQPKIDTRAFSPNWPQDIIYYDPYPENWVYDRSFCNTFDATSMVPNFKGAMFRRHDIRKDLIGDYDWRNCVIRRWTIDTSGVPAYSATAVYNIGDVVAGGGGVNICIGQGPTGLTDIYQWVNVILSGVCAIDPDNNPNYTPNTTYRQDLFVTDLANSATASTCISKTWTINGFVDQITFGPIGSASAIDPYAKNIDLGSYRYFPASTTFGVASPTGAYNSVVNCNILNATTSGGINANRLVNVKLPKRSFGNSFYSAGFVADNDTNNIDGGETMINNIFQPFPNPLSYQGIFIKPAFRNLKFTHTKNCYFSSTLSDCEFGPIKDSVFEFLHGVRIGTNTKSIVAAGASGSGWSTGNVVKDCEKTDFEGMDNCVLTKVFRSKFDRSISKVYIWGSQGIGNFTDCSVKGNMKDVTLLNSYIDNCHFNAAFQNNRVEGSTMRSVHFGGTATGNFIGPTSNLVESNFSGSFTDSTIKGSFTNNNLIGSVTTLNILNGATMANTAITNNVSAMTIDRNLGGLTGAQILGSNFSGQTLAGCTFAGTIQGCEFVGNMSTNYFPANITNSVFMGGLTGSTGLGLVGGSGGTVTGAHVIGGAINGLNMSGATQSIANRGKLYMLSNNQNPWVMVFNEAGGSASPMVIGATS